MEKIIIKIFLVCLVLCVICSNAESQIYYGSEYYELGYPIFMMNYLFFAEDSLVRTEIYIQTSNEHMQFLKRKYYFIALYEVELALLTENRLYKRIAFQDSIVAPNYSSTRASSPVILQPIIIKAPPGDYIITTKFVDLDSKKAKRLSEEIKLPMFGEEEYISSIKFLKGTGSKNEPYEPVISKRYFAHDTTLYLYFEVYPPMGIDTLNVSYLIINKKNKTVFSDSLEIHGAHKIENKVPMNNLEPGEFDLVIQLNRKDFHYTKKDNFTIMWSPMFQIKDDFEVIIKQLGYIASETWLDKLESASDSLKFGLFQQFWKEKDPTPDTDRNEVKDEFYRRVAYANRHFSGFKEGWQTPRGKVYIIYGHPDEIESHPFDMDSKPYEIWYYFQINKKFIFVDKDGTNEYYLYYEE